jgi:hypothetical protein
VGVHRGTFDRAARTKALSFGAKPQDASSKALGCDHNIWQGKNQSEPIPGGTMTTTEVAPAATTAATTPRTLGLVTIVAGIILALSGAFAWGAVQVNLSQENITVSGDSPRWADQPVDGPFTAYQEAEMINQHYLEATGGKTYAELDREDPLRDVAMNASFLRASLFTSVVSFGVAAMAMGLGVVLVLVGSAIRSLAGRRPVTA